MHLLTRHPVRLLVTVRPEDWQARLRAARANPEENTGLLLLATVLGHVARQDLPCVRRCASCP
jgi:hypothetical protein